MQWDELRNFLAHGMIFLIFETKTGKFSFEFRRYRRIDENQFQHLNWFISLEDLEKASNAMAEHSDKFLKAFKRIYIEEGLEKNYPELFE